MYDYENDCLYTEMLTDIEKIKIEMIMSHIILSRITGRDNEYYQSLSYLKKRSYMLRLYKKGSC